MTPKQFLLIGGIVLVVVGLAGFAGVIGPTEDSLFGPAWYFDNAENWAHLVLGIVGVLASFVLPGDLQRPLVMILGVVGVLVGLYSLFGPVTMGNNLLGAQLQNPADTILHVVVGIWALLASRKSEASAPAMV